MSKFDHLDVGFFFVFGCCLFFVVIYCQLEVKAQ